MIISTPSWYRARVYQALVGTIDSNMDFARAVSSRRANPFASVYVTRSVTSTFPDTM